MEVKVYIRMHNYLVLFICFVLLNSINSQETVYLEAGEFGRGILKNRNGECYIIAPLHVVNFEQDDIKVIGDGFVEDIAKYIKSFDSDLCVLKIKNPERFNCSEWELKRSFNEILESAYEGFLEKRNNNGNISIIPVSFSNKTDKAIVIKQKEGEVPFSKGMSGSSLFTTINGEKLYLGMLQQIEGDKGFVLQADDMERVLFEFFNLKKQSNVGSTVTNGEMVLETSKLISKDLIYLNMMYLKLIENNSMYLTNDFVSWILKSRENYVELPENYPITSLKKDQYNRTVKNVQIQLKECENLIKESKSNWSIKGITNISILSINLESLLETLN